MVLPLETISRGAPSTCEDCKEEFSLEVLKTCAYYVGTQCGCGMYSRETGYFETRQEAEEALTKIKSGYEGDLR